MPEPRKLRVFLCHASQDKPVVRELYKRLLAESWIDPWLDEEKLLPGQDWDMEIEKAVEAADAVIVCLSNKSVTKEGYVQKEIKLALNIALFKPEETIFIVPLRFDDCKLPRSLQSIQYIDYFSNENKDAVYARLVAGLQMKATSLYDIKDLSKKNEKKMRRDEDFSEWMRKLERSEEHAIILERARGYLREGDISAAALDYLKLIKKKVFLEEITDDLAKAVSLSYFSSNPILWQTVGDVYMRRNKVDDALDAYSKAEALLNHGDL